MKNDIHTIRANAIKERKRRDERREKRRKARARARFWANEQNQMGALLLAASFGGFVMWVILAF